MKLMTYRNPMTDFDSFFNDTFEAFSPFFGLYRPQNNGAQYHAEWFEDDDNYYARIDLPGLEKDTLNLEIDSDVVSISVKDSEEKRRFRVPEGIASERIEASVENGVLTMTLPKLPEKKPVTIKVS